MSKNVKRVLWALAGIFLIFVAYNVYAFATTKNKSPEETITFKDGDLTVSVFYNRPYKKDRVIFGELVPFGKVWRTGANEATTFTTNETLMIGGESLAAGTYTLWTIPEADQWEVIFNEKAYDWGVTMKDLEVVASREADGDVLNVKVPVGTTGSVVEQFTISLVGGEGSSFIMVLEWDQTRIEVPIQRANAAEVENEPPVAMPDSLPATES